MGQITSGVVKYGRTVKTGDYENKRADVEIAWSAVDDEDFQPTLDRAVDAAYRKCQDMLGLRHEKPAVATAPVSPQSAAEPSTRKAPRAAKVAAAPTAPASAPAVQPPPVATAGASAAAPDEDPDFPGTTPAEVTDKELHAAAQMTAARIKDSQPIRNLRDKYLEAGGMHLSDIPQAKRAAFLKELETLKAKAA